MNKRIVIITACYPFQGVEQFLYREFEELALLYEEVIVFPINKSSETQVPMPQNFKLDESLVNPQKRISKSKALFTHFGIMLYELFKNEKPLGQLKDFKKNLGYSIINLNRAGAFEDALENYSDIQQSDFYSTWMNEGAFVLSIAKKKNLIPDFIFRVNGVDIFSERHKRKYIRYRAFCIKHAKYVVALSKAGQHYIRNLGYDSKKVLQNYSGIVCNDQIAHEPESSEKLKIASCSSIVKLKRVELIVESISQLDISVEWTHFGDGPLRHEIEELIKTLPSNLKVDLRGNVDHKEIMDHYANEDLHAFVHLSETEGLGMALIEAQHYGLPIVACKVGGVPEIVEEGTGILLDKNCSIDQIKEALIRVRRAPYSEPQTRKMIKEKCLAKFDVKTNAKELIGYFSK